MGTPREGWDRYGYDTRCASVVKVSDFAIRRVKPISLPICLGSTFELDDCAHGIYRLKKRGTPSDSKVAVVDQLINLNLLDFFSGALLAFELRLVVRSFEGCVRDNGENRSGRMSSFELHLVMMMGVTPHGRRDMVDAARSRDTRGVSGRARFG